MAWTGQDVKAVRRPGLAALLFDESDEADAAILAVERGQFEVITEPRGQRRFWFVCPGPCKSIAPVALRPVVDGSAQSWEWDGNLEAPTLTPSINHVGCWHGWLTGGEFKSC